MRKRPTLSHPLPAHVAHNTLATQKNYYDILCIMNEKPPQPLPQESIKGDAHTAEYGNQIYDIYKLIHLSEHLPEEGVPLERLSHMQDGNYWKDEKGEWLGPHHILAAAKKYHGDIDWSQIIQDNPDWATELEKIRNSDYRTNPLLVIGEDFVIDGMHRLTKALLENASEIKIKRFDTLPNEAIYEERDDKS